MVATGATTLREVQGAIVRRDTTDRRTADEAILLRAATTAHLTVDRIARTTRCLLAVMEGHRMVVDTTRHRRTVEADTTPHRHTVAAVHTALAVEAASTGLRAVAVRTCPRVVVRTVGAEVLTEADTAKA